MRSFEEILIDNPNKLMDAEGKKLVDLRVVDLKQELEKRSLDICGVKNTLQERLKNVRALRDMFCLSRTRV